MIAEPEPLTGAYLPNERRIEIPQRRVPVEGRERVIHNAREHKSRCRAFDGGTRETPRVPPFALGDV